MRVEMSRPGELHRLIRSFLDYELPEIEEFRQAQQQFKADLPTVIGNLTGGRRGGRGQQPGVPGGRGGLPGAVQAEHKPRRVRRRRPRDAVAAHPHQGHLPEGLRERTSSIARTTSPAGWRPWSRPSSPATCAARPSTDCTPTTAPSAGPPTR